MNGFEEEKIRQCLEMAKILLEYRTYKGLKPFYKRNDIYVFHYVEYRAYKE